MVRAFRKADKNGDEYLTLEELATFLENMPEDDPSQLMGMDADGDGKLSLKEVLGVPQDLENVDPDPEVVQAFKKADVDGDGYLSPEELPMFILAMQGESTEL